MYESYHFSYYSLRIFHKMSVITKLFNRRTKKRDLSKKSKTGEDPKKVREGSLDCSQISQTSDIPDDIFTESLNTPDCVAIFV